VKIVDVKELFTTLYNQRSATFVGLLTEVTVPMRKTGNPFLDRVTKRQYHSCQISFDYSNSVNNRRDKEGNEPDFIPSFRKWGLHVTGSPLIIHTKKGETTPTFYLETRVLNSRPADYYLDKVKVINQATLADILSFCPEKHSNAEHQGVEREVIVRDFLLNSIKAITYNKETYIVEP